MVPSRGHWLNAGLTSGCNNVSSTESLSHSNLDLKRQTVAAPNMVKSKNDTISSCIWFIGTLQFCRATRIDVTDSDDNSLISLRLSSRWVSLIRRGQRSIATNCFFDFLVCTIIYPIVSCAIHLALNDWTNYANLHFNHYVSLHIAASSLYTVNLKAIKYQSNTRKNHRLQLLP